MDTFCCRIGVFVAPDCEGIHLVPIPTRSHPPSNIKLGHMCNHGLHLFAITFPQTHHVHTSFATFLFSSLYLTTIILTFSLSVSLSLSFPESYMRSSSFCVLSLFDLV